MNMLVTRQKFLEYQNIFFSKLKRTPYEIKLEIISFEKNNSGEFSLESFVGDSPRTSKFYTLQALYEKDVSDRTREKYGLPLEVNGVVYLSPKQLVPLFGDYHLSWNCTKVYFNGRVQVINKIIYLEEMYGSCVGIQIFLRDDNKGG